MQRLKKKHRHQSVRGRRRCRWTMKTKRRKRPLHLCPNAALPVDSLVLGRHDVPAALTLPEVDAERG
jgi:hypothetical protein